MPLSTSLDSCANVSLNRDLKIFEESLSRSKCSFGYKNAHGKSADRSDSAFGSEVAEEDHQSRDVSVDEHHQDSIDKAKSKTASKPASHNTSMTFGMIKEFNPDYKFNFEMSKIPVMKELEYRRTHLRHVENADLKL